MGKKGPSNHQGTSRPTNPPLLHVEIVDDDADEEVEGEEGAEDDEGHEVQVHERPVLKRGLLLFLISVVED